MTKNIEKYEISTEQMTSKIKISNLEFKTTKDLKPFEEILGQERTVISKK